MKKLLFLPASMLLLLCATGIAQSPPPCTIPTLYETTDSYISSVRLGTINNTTTGTPGAHSNYTNLSTNVSIGSTYSITVRSSLLNNFRAAWQVYIDYNKNGVYGDAGELIGSSSDVASGSSVSYKFIPPATAFNGPATLRIKMTQSLLDLDHCRVYSDAGETEDYTVNIMGGYCYSHGITSASDYISNVTASNLSRTSGNNGGYANYTSYTASMTSGFTYPISLSRLPSSTSRLEYWTVFIDYNGNKSFADNGDLVAMKSGTNVSVANINIPFLVPGATGMRRMRIIMSHEGYKTDPCATVTNGEVEDYTVQLKPPVNGTAKTAQTMPALSGEEAAVHVQPNPATTSNAVVRYTVVAAGTVTIHITDLSGRAVLVYNAGNKPSGTYLHALHAERNLSAGTYLVMVAQNGQEVAHSKFIIAP